MASSLAGSCRRWRIFETESTKGAPHDDTITHRLAQSVPRRGRSRTVGGGGGRISATALVSIACDMRRIADALTAPAQAPAVDTGWREYTPAQPVEAVQ